MFATVRLLSFWVSFVFISLGLFVAYKVLGYAPWDMYFAMLGMFFCAHAAIHILYDALSYEAGQDDESRWTCLIPLVTRRSLLGLVAVALMLGGWLMLQSGHVWYCGILFLSILAAMAYMAPSRCSTFSTCGAYFLAFNIGLALFATTYAVMTRDFTPYYLVVTVPVMLLIAGLVYAQGLATTDMSTGSHPYVSFLTRLLGKGRATLVSRLAFLTVWALMLHLITSYLPLVTPEKAMPPSLGGPYQFIAKRHLEAHSSASIEASTHDAMARGVTYGFGAKNSESGAIDCSGWITEMNQKSIASMNARMGSAVYGDKAKLALMIGANGGAAGIVLAMKIATGEELTNDDLTPDAIREGMIIGLDTGEKSWDTGRYEGIDHIVQTYKDHATGQIMVSQASGGKGVHVMPYDEWYRQWNPKAKLYGVDMSLLANPHPIPFL